MEPDLSKYVLEGDNTMYAGPSGLVDVVAVVEAAADHLAGRGEGEPPGDDLHISVLARTLSGCQ